MPDDLGAGFCMNKIFTLDFPMTIKDTYLTRESFPDMNAGLDQWSNNRFSPHFTDPIAAPGDLVSLAWLQKGDIIQIAPLDGEEETQSSLHNSTTSFSSFKSDVCHGFSTNLVHDESEDVSIFPKRSIPSGRLELSNAFQRLSAMDCLPSRCSVDSSFSHTSHLGLVSQGLAKPNYSYTHLIFMAIESTAQKCMTVNQIYNWCESNFPFYKHAGAGWKNSLRHNLSINKSFKRLPRDSRGPGRGAFWTVEPRERPTLLDAIKRNPWNFAAMTSLISSPSDFSGNQAVPIEDFPNGKMLSLRPLSLTQGTSSRLFHSDGYTHEESLNFQPDPSSGLLNSSVGLRLLPTVDGQFLIACSSPSVSTGSVEPSISQSPFCDPRSTPQSHGGLIAGSKMSGGVDWPAEEEEKYLHLLRSLVESDGGSLHETRNGTLDTRPCKSNQSNVNLGPSGDEIKLITKQRRKSRLQPTRIGTCNECKENAASGCEACHSRRSQFLLNRLDNSSFEERALVDVANALDSDQEHGPAGGPAVWKTGQRHNFVPLEKSCEITQHKVNCREATSQEVYVTPAPYIDHEYSHCQAQLRGPEDNRLVNRFNEIYCGEMIKRISHYRPYFKKLRKFKGQTTNVYNGGNSPNLEDDFCCSDGCESCIDESIVPRFKNTRFRRQLLVNGFCNTLSTTTKRGRCKRTKGSARLSLKEPNIPCRRSSFRRGKLKQRLSRSAVARLPRSSTNTKSTLGRGSRRSKRIIKAPRRPYDEFEASFSVSEFAGDLYDDPDYKTNGTTYSTRLGDFVRNSEDVNSNYSTGVRCRRGRSRVSRWIYRPMARDSDTDYFSDHSNDTDAEAQYLQQACKRPKVYPSIDRDGTSSQSYPSSDPSYQNSFFTGVISSHTSPSCSIKDSPSITQCDVPGVQLVEHCEANAEKYRGVWGTESQEASETESHELCDEDVEVQCDVSRINEQTTVKAAQILLGISQMQSFRRQSGYLSLDSSGTSSCPSDPVPPGAQDGYQQSDESFHQSPLALSPVQNQCVF